MSISLEMHYTSCDQSFDPATHEVMCLVKRHLYELAFVVPLAPQSPSGDAQPCLYMRVKAMDNAGGFRLNLEDVECLYEDILQMMEYVQNERQRMEASKPIA